MNTHSRNFHLAKYINIVLIEYNIKWSSNFPKFFRLVRGGDGFILRTDFRNRQVALTHMLSFLIHKTITPDMRTSCCFKGLAFSTLLLEQENKCIGRQMYSSSLTRYLLSSIKTWRHNGPNWDFKSQWSVTSTSAWFHCRLNSVLLF